MTKFFSESTSLYEEFTYGRPLVVHSTHLEQLHYKIDCMLLAAQSQEIDDITFEEDETSSPKYANRDKYEKHLGGRRNQKEKRQQLRRQLKDKNKKRREKKNVPLDPHGWTEYLNMARSASKGADFALSVAKNINAVKEAVRYSGTSHTDFGNNILSRLEDLTALIVGLSTVGSIPAAISLIHLYLRTHYSQPVTLKLKGWIEHVLNVGIDETKKITNQARKILDLQSAEENYEKAKQFRSLVKDWKKNKDCPLAKNLTNIVNILVTFGFLPSWDQDPLKCGDFEIFRAKAWNLQKDSPSFLDMSLDTISFFLERGFAAFVHKDLSLLLYEDNEAATLEAEYSLLVSALPLLEAGRLKDLSKFSKEIVSESDFDIRLENLIGKFFGKLKMETSTYMRNTYTNKLVVLKKLRVALIMAQKSSCIRDKPYGVLLYGASAVGKSMINSVMLKVLLHHNGFPSKKEHVVVLNDSDKFQSEYKACHVAVTLDDYGNTKAEHYDVAPTNKIIDFLNNIPKAALNPNVELKGNVMIQPKMVSVTTNKKDLMAGTFSNEPVSILRRFDVVMDIRLRPEFEDPETGGLDGSKIKGQMIPDAWYIDLQRVKIIRGKDKDFYEFKTILKDASLIDCFEWMKTHSEDHFAMQKDFVASVEELYDMELCKHSYSPRECPHCKSGASIDTEIVVKAFEENMDTQCLLDPLGDFDTDNPSILRQVNATIRHLSPNPVERLAESVADWYVERKVNSAVGFVQGACDTIQEAFEKHKKEILVGTLATLGISSAVYGGLLMYRHFNNIRSIVEQGSEISKPLSEEELRPPIKLDSDVPNPWKAVKPVSLKKTEVSRCSTVEDLVGKLSHNLAHITIIDRVAGTQRKCDIFPLEGNVWLLPTHMLADHELEIQVQTTRKDTLGKNFTQKIDPTCFVKLAGDFSVIRLVCGGDVPRFSRFLLEDDFKLTGRLHATILHKDEEGVVAQDCVRIMSKRKLTSRAGQFEGVDYNYPRLTFPGLCMAPLVALQRGASIIGFHLAGRNGTTYGAAGVITRQQIADGIAMLDKKFPLSVHSSGELLTSKYGIDFTPDKPIEKEHCVRKLADKDGVQPLLQVVGAHGGGSVRFRSQVRKSPISDAVTEVMDIPRIHGPPSARDIKKHWERDLNLMAFPANRFVPRILERSYCDLERKILRFLERNPEAIKMVHPYPKDYVLSGMDGVTTVDRVELNSSMGFPINKKKKFFLRPVDREVPGVTEPIDFEDPQYWAEVERMEQVLLSGERIYVIHRGNLKDEPTKFTKDKIRVFAGCEFAFTCLVRKYYLPIVRLMQTHWKDFECAVGINAHGPQWQELKSELTRMGEDRMIAGDYKAFDKAMSTLLTRYAFRALIRIAIEAGYKPEYIKVMEGIATEISIPLYEYDGVLVMLFGSNPSGHPLTVIVNNLANSLYLRYAYYTMHDNENVVDFDQAVALVCYGDDNAASVSPDEEKFTHTNVAKVLADIGVTYTMADKKAESVPLIPLSDVSFLKRGFRFDEDIGSWVAPLEVDSISKSLHNYMYNKGSDVLSTQIAAQALSAANMEFFYHGREVFEQRRSELYAVAEKAGILDVFEGLDTYDELLNRFEGRRIPDVKYTDALDILDTQSASVPLDEHALMEQVIADFPARPVIREDFMGSCIFGAPDLVFYFPACMTVIVVETKFLKGSRLRRKMVKKQAMKYALALHVLVPSFTILALTYTERGYSYVATFGLDESRVPEIDAILSVAGVNTDFLDDLVTVSPLQGDT
jgi:hypothetical protein